jgi:GT2 family glycosyltransferase
MTANRDLDPFDDELDSLLDAGGKPPDEVPEWFDEEAYLQANPDVSESINQGEFETAYHHYILHGRAERRPLYGTSQEPRNRLMRVKRKAGQAAGKGTVVGSVEVIMVSPRGAIFVVGWVDDTNSPLEFIRITGPGWYLTLTSNRTARFRRQDVESALGSQRMHSYGFFGFVYTETAFDSRGKCTAKLHLLDESEVTIDVTIRPTSESEIRNSILSYVSTADFFGNRHVEAVRAMQGFIGQSVVKHNRDITRDIVAGAHVERFGPQGRKLRGSLIVCLYGKPEYLFLQNALFTGGKGFEDYEMVYVSNSPEMAEQLLKDLQTGTLTYNIPQTLVLLPGNAGFGAANNVAANYANTDRLMIVNPDVFPRDPEWAYKHTQAISNLPKLQTTIFGAPLYYDDGSLMHGGMYFQFDTGISVEEKSMSGKRMVRVEHYGKGAPPWSTQYTRPRPVPAVTGAFISINRAWFEKLGGFTEDFVFGHYEDADLCLKSLSAGIAPWIQDIRLWHLEGKGSKRLPVHEGGSYVNRTIFSQRWDSVIAQGLEGPEPTHPLLNPPALKDVSASAEPRPASRLASRTGT